MKKRSILVIGLLALSLALSAQRIRKLNLPQKGVDELKIVELQIDSVRHGQDLTRLGNLLRLDADFYGLSHKIERPKATVWVYINPDKDISEEDFKRLVETKSFEMPVHGGKTNTTKLDLSFVSMNPHFEMIARQVFLDESFPSKVWTSKMNLEKYENDESAVYEIVYDGLEKPMVQRQLPFLVSYLTGEDGIIKIETKMHGDNTVIQITYAKTVLNDDKLWSILTAEKWKIYYSEDEVELQDPTMVFKEKGATIN